MTTQLIMLVSFNQSLRSAAKNTFSCRKPVEKKLTELHGNFSTRFSWKNTLIPTKISVQGRQIQLLCQIYRIQNGGSNMANKISKKIRIAFLNFNVRRWISYFEFQKSDFTFHI